MGSCERCEHFIREPWSDDEVDESCRIFAGRYPDGFPNVKDCPEFREREQIK